MNTFIKNRITELEKEVEELETQIVKKLGSGRIGTLKSEQWRKMNEIKKLRLRLGDDNS